MVRATGDTDDDDAIDAKFINKLRGDDVSSVCPVAWVVKYWKSTRACADGSDVKGEVKGWCHPIADTGRCRVRME